MKGFDEWIQDHYKMNPLTFKTLYENKYRSDKDAYRAGMAEQKELDAEIADDQGEPEIAEAIRNQGNDDDD